MAAQKGSEAETRGARVVRIRVAVVAQKVADRVGGGSLSNRWIAPAERLDATREVARWVEMMGVMKALARCVGFQGVARARWNHVRLHRRRLAMGGTRYV